MKHLKAGSCQVDISPTDSQFLFGYPYVERYSTGIHDPLLSSSLYLSDGYVEVIFIANDIIFVPKEVVARCRAEISRKTGVPGENIMITATHTHSGPHTVNYLSNQADKAVPPVDESYVAFMEKKIIQSGISSFENAVPAMAGLTIADDTGVGTNRRDPAGPADHQVPVVVVKNCETGSYIACMLVCSMHPTVLHEDSTLISGDFPGLSRITLQNNVLGKNCAVLHHTGPSGNQSPRHVIKANTFDQAQRLGEILAGAVEKTLATVDFRKNLTIKTAQVFLEDLPKKEFPPVDQARQSLDRAVEKFETLKKQNAPSNVVRTAECDWFGAEEALTLSKAASKGQLDKEYSKCLPAEIQVIKLAEWSFAAWQGEVFTDYALHLKQLCPNTFVISMANGELQGYITTEQAAKEGGYEASNSLFSHKAGPMLVERTAALLEQMNDRNG